MTSQYLQEVAKPVRIVNRDAWSLIKPEYTQRLDTPVDLIVLRYTTDTPICTGDEECFRVLRNMQKAHMDWGLPDVAFNFMVGGDGTVYEGRGWTSKSTKLDWTTLKHHGKSIDIAYIGDIREHYPPDVMGRAVCRLIRKGEAMGYVDPGWTIVETRETTPHLLKDMVEEYKRDPDERIYDSI